MENNKSYSLYSNILRLTKYSRKLYDYYKGKYSNLIVIVKEGIFYKSYLIDGKIIWYLFNYKYSNDCVSFGNNSYDKVILKLKKSNISFVVVDKEKELLLYLSDDIFYNSYCSLASKSYEKYEIESKIVDEVRSIIETYPDKCEVIWEFLVSLKS